MKRAVLSCVVSFLMLPAIPSGAADEAAGFTRKEDVLYGRKYGMALTLDVFTPPKPNGAGVVFLVCGGWYSAHDWIHPVFFAELLKRGYTVFAVVHGSQPLFTIPDNVADVNRAVRFIRHHARDYGIDPDRLGITGGSAGGQLALMQATAGDHGDPKSADPVERTSSRVQAVACFFPLTDLLNYGGKGKVMQGDGVLAVHKSSFDFREFDQKTHAYVPVTDAAKRREILRRISPIYFVTADDPPALIIHGDQDDVVPLQQSEAIVARLREVGVPVELVVKKGGGHGWKDFWQQDMPVLADWFDKHLLKPAKRP
jgi:acetyl esterase/lipase